MNLTIALVTKTKETRVQRSCVSCARKQNLKPRFRLYNGKKKMFFINESLTVAITFVFSLFQLPRTVQTSARERWNPFFFFLPFLTQVKILPSLKDKSSVIDLMDCKTKSFPVFSASVWGCGLQVRTLTLQPSLHISIKDEVEKNNSAAKRFGPSVVLCWGVGGLGGISEKGRLYDINYINGFWDIEWVLVNDTWGVRCTFLRHMLGTNGWNLLFCTNRSHH